MIRDAPRRLRWIEAAIVGLTLLLGLDAASWWGRTTPWDIEATLGLEPTMIQRAGGYRADREELARRMSAPGGRRLAHAVSVLDAAGVAPIVMASLTVGAWLATIRTPGGLGRRAGRSPGVVILRVATILVVAAIAADGLSRRFLRGSTYLDLAGDDLSVRVGLSVVAVAALRALDAPGWRAIEGWDRLGRWVGAGWAVLLIWNLFLKGLLRNFVQSS